MFEATIVFGVVYFFVCAFISFAYSAKVGRIALISWAVLGMGLVYGLGWVTVAYVTHEGGNTNWARWITPYQDYYLIHNLCALLLLPGIFLGWKVASRFSRNAENFSAKKFNFTSHGFLVFAWIFLIVSFFLQVLYVQAYGGLFEYLEFSVLVRSGVFEIDNPFSFLKPFGDLALFSSFLFWGARKDGVKRFSSTCGLFLSFSFSLYILYSWLGRIGFFVYLFAFILASLVFKKVPSRKILLGSIVGGGVTIFLVYQLSVLLDVKGADGLLEFAAGELSFPFGSFFAQLSTGEHLARGFRDFLFAPLYLLPSSFWAGWLENVSQINTAVVEGAAKGEQGVTGGIPVDLITLGLMQANIFGVFLTALIFGFLLRVLQGFLDGFKSPGIRSVFFAYFSIKVAILAVFYAHPVHVVVGNSGFIFSFLILMFFSRASRISVR